MSPGGSSNDDVGEVLGPEPPIHKAHEDLTGRRIDPAPRQVDGRKTDLGCDLLEGKAIRLQVLPPDLDRDLQRRHARHVDLGHIRRSEQLLACQLGQVV